MTVNEYVLATLAGKYFLIMLWVTMGLMTLAIRGNPLLLPFYLEDKTSCESFKHLTLSLPISTVVEQRNLPLCASFDCGRNYRNVGPIKQGFGMFDAAEHTHSKSLDASQTIIYTILVISYTNELTLLLLKNTVPHSAGTVKYYHRHNWAYM
jgi:hypothetical protein